MPPESATPPAPPAGSFVTVRFVQDTQSSKCWFEEKLLNGQWVIIPETRMSCEGNARSVLADVLEKRRQQRLMIFHKTGPEEIFKIA